MQDAQDFDLIGKLAIKHKVVWILRCRQEPDASKPLRAKSWTNAEAGLVSEVSGSVENVFPPVLCGDGIVRGNVAGVISSGAPD